MSHSSLLAMPMFTLESLVASRQWAAAQSAGHKKPARVSTGQSVNRRNASGVLEELEADFTGARETSQE